MQLFDMDLYYVGSSAIHYAVDGGQDNVIGYIVQNKLAVSCADLCDAMCMCSM